MIIQSSLGNACENSTMYELEAPYLFIYLTFTVSKTHCLLEYQHLFTHSK